MHVYGPGPWMPPHLEFIVVGAVGATQICRFIWFGAVDATKPFYQFIKLGAVEATNTCKFLLFMAMEVIKPLIYSVWGRGRQQNLWICMVRGHGFHHTCNL